MNKNCEEYKVGIVANKSSEKTAPIKDELYKKLSKKNIICVKVFDGDIVDADALENFSSTVDVIFAVGGDGTLLSVLRSCGKNNLPVIGINAGRKGFLAEISTDEIVSWQNRMWRKLPFHVAVSSL